MRKLQTVADLLDLQAVDSAIDALMDRRSSLPALALYKAVHEALAAIRTDLDERQRTLTSIHRSLDRLEGEASIARTKREETQVKMYTPGSSAKEVQHLGWEVEQLGRQIEAREEEELTLLEQADELEPEVARLTAEVDRLTAEKSLHETTIRDEWAAIDAELARKEARKAAEVAEIDPDLLAVYEKVRAVRGGVGVGALTDGVCGACHVALSAAEIHALRSEDLPRCVHCGRLLAL